MLVKVIFEKPYIFQKSIFKKMPPDTPRNRIRDLPGASLLVVKGFPKADLNARGSTCSSAGRGDKAAFFDQSWP